MFLVFYKVPGEIKLFIHFAVRFLIPVFFKSCTQNGEILLLFICEYQANVECMTVLPYLLRWNCYFKLPWNCSNELKACNAGFPFLFQRIGSNVSIIFSFNCVSMFGLKCRSINFLILLVWHTTHNLNRSS